MAALNVLERARELRWQNALLRMEMARLTEQAVLTRRIHVERRQECEIAVFRSAMNRDRLPTGPAWSGPTPELRLTLVPVE